MKLDLVKLRKLAASATQPGLWSVSEEHPNLILDANGFWLAAVGRDPKDAAFIAACSPDVVLALLDEVERLRAIAENAACWLESNSDKSARRFHAARVRHEIGEPA